MKFGIITYILHKEKNGRFYSYAPYITEMNMWLKNAEETLIAAPKISGTISPIEIPYSEAELKFQQIPALNFTTIGKSLISLLKMPKVIWGILKVMRKCDHIHLRCPGNISLIACFLQIFFPKKPKTVKYAGNWDPEAKQPWSYKLQKKILSNIFLSRNVKVLVYGNWPNQSANIFPFFTASFSESEKVRIDKEFTTPFKFLFVGSLVAGKKPLYAIKLIEALMAKAIPVTLDLYGDGILKKELEEYVEQKNLDPFITFRGNIPLEEINVVYKNSHFLILVSQSEGWPKAVAEGMFFGCVPIATAVSCVPWMLAALPEGGANSVTRTERGILAPPVPEGEAKSNEWLEEIVEEVGDLLKDHEEMKRLSSAAQEWSQEYTLEKFEEAIKEILAPNPRRGSKKRKL